MPIPGRRLEKPQTPGRPQTPEERALARDLRRLLASRSCPVYLRASAAAWLAAHPGPAGHRS